MGARFPAHVQTGPGGPPTMGTSSFPGENRLGRGVEIPRPSSTDVKERVELYVYSLFVPSLQDIGVKFSLCEKEILDAILNSFSKLLNRRTL